MSNKEKNANKERFLKLVSDKKTNTLERVKLRRIRREMLRESQQIALKVLNRLDELEWTQKRLAEEMGVSPQQINKIVRGKENLTLESIAKLQSILNIPLLASFYEKGYQRPLISKDIRIQILLKHTKLTSEENYISEKQSFSFNMNTPSKFQA